MGVLLQLCELFDCEIGHFVEGVKSLSSHPIRKLLNRKKSKMHCKSVEKYVATNATSGGSGINMLQKAAERKLSEEKNINTKYMQTVIKTVVFTVKNKWALDSVSSLTEFLKENNSQDVVNLMQKHYDLTYTSSFSVTDVLSSINTVLVEDLLKCLNEAKFYAFLADESSDDSRRERFAILARFRRNGKVGDHYLGLIEVQRTDAESLMKEIQSFLIAKGIRVKMRGLLDLTVVIQ